MRQTGGESGTTGAGSLVCLSFTCLHFFLCLWPLSILFFLRPSVLLCVPLGKHCSLPSPISSAVMVRGGEAACPHADATRWCHQRSKACRDLPAWLLCRLLFDLLTLWFWCLPVGGVSLPILGPSLHPILLSISDSLSQRFWKVLASSLPQPPLPHLPYSINFPFLLLFLILGKSFGPQSLPPCWNIFSFVRSHEGLHEGHMKRVRWGHQR